ncbi:tetratricopeptide repeat protein [Fictibacillus sp. KU28468]|uniref:response regulator aspartate phosphatase n=1 Tax=Fictibacillus sp. KU28468 TaxID=2991053 RepID=UPI00223CC156|nr:tetratricopeptide repeat protein [Fictibacillus sp. KU28468]UZJ79476.1 tetratricopeptide repeat protein [Fictibacillus sp. KU28468]
MEAELTSTEQMIQLLNGWYREILSQNLVESRRLKLEIDEKIETMEMDPTQTLFIYYSLLSFRYQLLVNDLWEARYTLNKLDVEKKRETDDFLSYYFHFFKAIYATDTGNYLEAKLHYQLAEKMLNQFPDDIEKAEFNYKVATFYYHTRQPLLAVRHAIKAKEYFEDKSGYEVKLAGCENIIGLASTSLKQFREAEHHFLTALDILRVYNLKKEPFELKIRYNLGLLYAEQNLSEKAIAQLTEVFEDKATDYKTTFLIAREHVKLRNHDIADDWIIQGLKIARDAQNEEYIHHFSILSEYNQSSSAEQLEQTAAAAIPYFQSVQLWGFVQDYAEKLASEFYNTENDQKASKYFHMAYTAKQKLMYETSS